MNHKVNILVKPFRHSGLLRWLSVRHLFEGRDFSNFFVEILKCGESVDFRLYLLSKLNCSYICTYVIILIYLYEFTYHY